MDDLERKSSVLCTRLRVKKCGCDVIKEFAQEVIEEERLKAFEEAAKAIKESRLELPDEPHELWLRGFDAAKDVFTVMMGRLATTRRE